LGGQGDGESTAPGRERIGGAVASAVRPLAAAIRPPDNEALYRSPEVVTEWSENRELQPPEAVILDRLRPWLASRTMLDIGVGNGRTAWHFAPVVASYVGVDYSPAMIADCRSRVGDSLPNANFAVEDVRDLREFESGSFDFVLFSFNGLDLIGHADRLRALSELHRVCAPSGVICFSSHNLSAVSQLWRLRSDQRTTLYRRARGLVQQAIFRFLNPPRKVLARSRYALIREGYFDFRSVLYYVRPSEQRAQLAHAGFSGIEVYGLDGRRIAPTAADGTSDLWLYYTAART
jgi:ubiquinone/menaquinone biosynthesis C-methylase UbiE